MADVNFSGISTPLGRFLTVTGFGSVQSLVGVRQTPVLGYAQTVAATMAAVPTTGIVATFSDAGNVGGGGGSNTQEVLNVPSNWRGYVTGLEIGFPVNGPAAVAVAPAVFAEFLQTAYIRVTCGGIDTDIPMSTCYRIISQDPTVVTAQAGAGRNPYFFSSPLFWAGDGSEVVRLMQTNSITAPGSAWDLSLTLHVALGRSQDNSEIQPGFGGPTNCPSGDEYLAATQLAAGLRRSVSG